MKSIHQNDRDHAGRFKRGSKGHFVHGMTRSRLYRIWAAMKSRCFNANRMYYANYGGRGITVCSDWLIFEEFKKWSESSGYMDNLEIDRMNNDGNYCPENCHWVTRKENRRNRRQNRFLDIFGERKPIWQWAEDQRCLVPAQIFKLRIQRQWDFVEAMTRPLRKRQAGGV